MEESLKSLIVISQRNRLDSFVLRDMVIIIMVSVSFKFCSDDSLDAGFCLNFLKSYYFVSVLVVFEVIDCCHSMGEGAAHWTNETRQYEF